MSQMLAGRAVAGAGRADAGGAGGLARVGVCVCVWGGTARVVPGPAVIKARARQMARDSLSCLRGRRRRAEALVARGDEGAPVGAGGE